ncbi:MAG TPA: rod shape-determining protein [Anaerolineales bacterium]|jgi:rod shape-determining protein MreB|nr:rod shape-determining protein [Anaerolineales bacterium]
MAVFSKDLGIDLGTMCTRIVSGDNLLLEEPTVVAIAVEEQKIVSVGEEAQTMFGKVPDSIEVARPMQNGVISDYEITEKFLEYIIRKVSGSNRFFRPKVMITVPFGVTSVESRAVHEAILQAGTREAYLIQQPLAAALGMDLPIGTPSGNMVLSLGAGTVQAAVLAMYGIVAAESLRAGGMQLDEAIVSYIRKKYGLIIGTATAEKVKLELGTAVRQEEERSIEIQAQDQVSGLPRPLNLTNDDVMEALTDPLKTFVETARKVLEKTPPELVSDIIDRGVAICGGGAFLPGIDRLMTKELGVPAYLVDNPLTCIAEGAAIALDTNIFPKIQRNLPPI